MGFDFAKRFVSAEIIWNFCEPIDSALREEIYLDSERIQICGGLELDLKCLGKEKIIDNPVDIIIVSGLTTVIGKKGMAEFRSEGLRCVWVGHRWK